MIHALTLQLAATQKTNIDAAMSIADVVFAGTERMAAHHLAAARNAADATMGTAKSMLAVKDLHELAQLPSAWLQPGIEKALAHVRGLHDIATQTQQGLMLIVDTQFAELNKTVADTMSKTARQATEIAEANVAAATSASIRAVGNTAATAATAVPAPKARKAA